LSWRPVHLALPIAIGRWTPELREGGCPATAKDRVEGANGPLRTPKRGVPVSIPVANPLKAIVDAAPAHDAITLCTNSRESRGPSQAFGQSVQVPRRAGAGRQIGEDGRFHGLRHSVATTCASSALTPGTIADLLGQKTLAMGSTILEDADLGAKLHGDDAPNSNLRTQGNEIV